eukprot:CAMPEP_0117663544 /NCGR_PEP_ID=MMETSP0804-20121206/8675_1 /TAXON_ID=1074897 /ORGANISM="Tetraselmis astigmatica, Strain CCMP880" /LENGTH=462 /DNA_ID=CAMNT_0005470581 /DNA_START=1 /DNA_END=1389 /DNA_ORIENTATION=-
MGGCSCEHIFCTARAPCSKRRGAMSDSLCLRRVVLAACFLLPVVAASSGRSLLLEDRVAWPENLPGCDEGVLEYLQGSKLDEPVIPYSAGCIQRCKSHGAPLKMPPTVGLHLKGLPKTGTTWTELVITELLQRICESRIYSQCRHEHKYEAGHRRQLHIEIPGQDGEEDTRVSFVRLTVEYKHLITYNATCEHLKGHPNFEEACYQFKLDRIRNLVRSEKRREMHGYRGEEWKDCIYKGPYSRITECIPEYLRVAKFPWHGDMGVMELMGKAFREGHTVDPSEAQRKYVVTLRDPRDSAISNVHYTARADDTNEYVMTSGCKDYITAFALFYYWQIEVQGQVYPTLPIWYRDAVDDPVGEVVKILKFTGLRATQEVVDQVVHETSADAMRKKEEEGGLVGANRDEGKGAKGMKTRKATYNTFMEELNSTATEMCNTDMRRVLSDDILEEFGLMDRPTSPPPG